MKNSIILNVDSYKTSHYLQYPPGTKYVSSYIESRGGDHERVTFFGLQMFIKEYLSKPITHEDVDEAKTILQLHGVPFNETGWRYIVDEHSGYLPIEIQAIPEGTVLPTKNVMVQVMNTDPACPWLTSYIETALLRAIWYPTTVATVSRECRDIIEYYLAQTADSSEGLEFKLHDFGARGATSEEAAAIGGAAHLVNFMGTDNISGVLATRRYYGAEMAGFSIPAAEHSTITCWGKEREAEAYENMVEQFSGAEKTVAVVSDSYDLWHAVDNIWGGELKEQVENNGGTIVIRPDSGDPISIVVGTIDRLMKKFGFTTNEKGYRVLPPYIRVIQGDGISAKTIKAILEAMKLNQQSAENISFGMGGELLQKVNRDTLRFAMKASAANIEGAWIDVYKDPITDQGKKSKKGRLALVETDNNSVKTIREEALADQENLLQLVFKDGDIIREQTMENIRQLALAS